jgi:hypothetical protein
MMVRSTNCCSCASSRLSPTIVFNILCESK